MVVVVFCFLRMVKEEVSDKVAFEKILAEDERVSCGKFGAEPISP